MKIHCPKCNQIYELPEEKCGKIFSCLECGEDFLLPERPPTFDNKQAKLPNTPPPANADHPPKRGRAPRVAPPIGGKKSAFPGTPKTPNAGNRSEISSPASSSTGKGGVGIKRFPEWAQVAFWLVICLIALGIGIRQLYRYAGKTAAVPVPVRIVDPRKEAFMAACQAIENKDSMQLNRAIEGMNLNYCDDNGDTLLHFAVKNKNSDIMQMLLLGGASPQRENRAGETPLHLAAKNRDLAMVKSLLAQGATLTSGGSGTDSVIAIAAGNGDMTMLQYFLESYKFPREGSSREKAIFRAIYGKHPDCARELLPHYDIETLDKNGNTILMAAIQTGNLEIARLALQRGAHTDVENKKGSSAFFLAVRTGLEEITSLFEFRRMNLSQTGEGGLTLPMLCVENGSLVLLEKLLTPENIRLLDQEGRSVLYHAAAARSEDMVRLLLSRNAPFSPGPFEKSPLYPALLNGDYAIVVMLVDGGINITGKDRNGCNSLMLAAEAGDLKTVQYLQTKKFRSLEVNNAGKNAYDLALARSHVKVAAFLKDWMTDEFAEEINADCQQLLEKDLNMGEALKALEDIQKRAGENVKAKRFCEETRSQLKVRENDRKKSAVLLAMEQAKKDRIYESAIRTLEAVIKKYPDASNIADAQRYCERLKQEAEQEKKRQEALRKKREKIEKMSSNEIKSELAHFVDSWLSKMRLGEDTSQYWLMPSVASKLFDLKSWEIFGVIGDYSPRLNVLSIQVESSTKGGFPIRKTWKVTITRDDNLDWKVLSMTNEE